MIESPSLSLLRAITSPSSRPPSTLHSPAARDGQLDHTNASAGCMCVPLEVGQRHQQQGLRDLPDPASRRSPIPQKAKSNWERTPSNTHARWTSTTIELLLTPRTHLRNAIVIRHVPATASPYGLGACCPPYAATQPSLSYCTCPHGPSIGLASIGCTARLLCHLG